MTHNGHFYINLLYGWEHNERMKDKVKRMHLRKSSAECAEFNVIEKAEDDIKTCYQGLWLDLRFIYECREASPRLLLNPIRRIVDTYEMFNGLQKGSFFSNASKDLNKLPNLGSHGLDDLEYEITYKEKEELMEDFRKAFCKNNAKKHFNRWWKGREKFNEKQNYTV